MNDYWNDPPEVPELPECCGDDMEFESLTGNCVCLHCGKIVSPPPDIEPLPNECCNEHFEYDDDGNSYCPHCGTLTNPPDDDLQENDEERNISHD